MAVAPAGSPPSRFDEEFIDWFRAASEAGWARLVDADLTEDRLRWPRWRRGTHWEGALSEHEVSTVEERHGLTFSMPHRLFLQTLHSTQPDQYSPDQSRDRDNPTLSEWTGFYHWHRDAHEVRDASRQAVEGIVRDVLADDFWGPSWGPCPHDLAEREARLRELMGAAPSLAPIFGHRFVVNHGDSSVLSIVGTDVVVYGTDLRDYLLQELHDVLDIPKARISHDVPVIPLWGDLLEAQN